MPGMGTRDTTMPTAEEQLIRAIDDMNDMAAGYYASMVELDRKIAALSVKREENSLLYDQCIARLRDLESDLEWVQSE
jgi:hypothetical protein